MGKPMTIWLAQSVHQGLPSAQRRLSNFWLRLIRSLSVETRVRFARSWEERREHGPISPAESQ